MTAHHFTFSIKNHAACAGGTLIDGSDILCHFVTSIPAIAFFE
jgi:hypothetical protein